MESISDEEFFAMADAATSELEEIRGSLQITDRILDFTEIASINLMFVSLPLSISALGSLFSLYSPLAIAGHDITEIVFGMTILSLGVFAWTFFHTSKRNEKLHGSAAHRFLDYLRESQPERFGQFEEQREKALQNEEEFSARGKKSLIRRRAKAVARLKQVSARDKHVSIVTRAKAVARLKKEEEDRQQSLEMLKPYAKKYTAAIEAPTKDAGLRELV